MGFSFTLTNNSGEDRNYLITFPWRKVYHEDEGRTGSAWNSAEILLNGQLKDYYFKDIKGDEEPSGQVEWAGLGDVYFFKALVFGKNPATKVTLFKPSKEDVAEIWVQVRGGGSAPGQTGRDEPVHLSGTQREGALCRPRARSFQALFYSNYKILDIMSEYLMKFLRFCNSGFQVSGIKIPGHSQLRDGHHPPHDHHQDPFHPAHSQEHEIHEKDAGPSAADCEAQGEISKTTRRP